MTDGLEHCPYCEARVKNIERHITIQHKKFTLKNFLIESKITVITGSILLSALLLVVLDFHPLIIRRIHLHHILMGLSITVGGVPLAKGGITELIKEHAFDVDSLVVIAALGAVAIGYWTEAGVLIFLFSLAETLEDYSVFRSRRSLKTLLDLSPSTAKVLKNGELVEVPPTEVDVGEIVVVRPGDRIPVDGKVQKGNSALNEAPITGESIPKQKTKGDMIYAGTLNIDGALEAEAVKRSSDSTLSRIVEMAEEAEMGRAKAEQFVNTFAAYYTPAVLLFAVGVFLIPPLVFSAPYIPWLYRALVLLVLSCPCAFVISTPVTMLSAVTTAARHGVLVKGGVYLEKIKKTKTVVFDKTGTLTTGNPEVTRIVMWDNRTENEIIRIAAALETNSAHPFARPIIKKSGEFGDTPYDVEKFKSLTGAGIEGVVQGTKYVIGSPTLFDLSLEEEKKLDEMTSGGETVVALGEGKDVIAYIGLQDTVREGAKKIVKVLKTRGIQTIMLTGDNEANARAAANELGIDEYISQVLPEEKVATVERLQQQTGPVIMVGDGINDAPALVKSDVGIAMGAAGSDTAMESADMALMEDDLSKLLYLFDLSNDTMKTVKENIYISIGVKMLLAVLAFFGLVTLWMAVGAGDAGMALFVTVNAILLGKK